MLDVVEKCAVIVSATLENTPDGAQSEGEFFPHYYWGQMLEWTMFVFCVSTPRLRNAGAWLIEIVYLEGA